MATPVAGLAPRRLAPRRLARRFGVDRAVAVSIAGRAWQAASTAVTVVLIVATLSPVQQGYYYAVQNLVAWQIVVELGLGFVLMQVASHERAGLELDAAGRLVGDAGRIARIASLLRQAVRWYAVASVMLGAVLLPAGWRLLGTHATAGLGAMRWVWFGVVLAAAASLLLLPLLAVLEGLGQVAEVAQVRLAQDVTSFFALWSFFGAGAGLGALVAFHALRTVIAAYVLARRHHALFGQLLRHPIVAGALDWRREVWPLQWRVGLSSLSGLFLFYMVNPLAFVHYSATDAGRLGMSQNLMNGVQSVALVWTSTKSPHFGQLVARRAWSELDDLFGRAVRTGALVAVLGCLVAVGGSWWLQHAGWAVGRRVLPAELLALLAVPVLINQLTFSQSLYLRAHRRDPFLVPSVLGAMLTVLVLLQVSRLAHFASFVTTYALLSVPGLLVSTWVFRRQRVRFRAAA